MMPAFKKTPDQAAASKLLASPAKWILLHGGSRSGKTFILVRALVLRALKAPGSRHAIFRLRFNHVKQSIFMETLPEVLKKCFPLIPVTWNHSDFFIQFPNGSEIWIGGLDDKQRTEKILGKEFATIYLNEASQIPFSSVSIAETRLAQNVGLVNKIYFDCNPPPKSHWLYSYFFLKLNPESKKAHPRPELYANLQMNPAGNRENLPPEYIETVLGSLSDRKRKRFQDGIWLDDVEGALWTRTMINATRVVTAPELVRIVVAVDPAVTATRTSNRTGIIVDGIDVRGHGYTLADRTMERASPAEWGAAVVNAYHEFAADAVVGEVNNGGDLVERNIKVIDPMIRFKGVHATRGKIIRAEPLAGLYEQGKWHHVGEFPELEEEQCSYAPQLQNEETYESPDRLDAHVWGAWDLTEKFSGEPSLTLAFATGYGGNAAPSRRGYRP